MNHSMKQSDTVARTPGRKQHEALRRALIAAAALSWAAGTQAGLLAREDFDGGGGALDGKTATSFSSAVALAGGSSAWAAGSVFLDNGSVTVNGSDSSASLNLGSYIDDTAGTPSGKFALTLTISETTATWISAGFSTLNTPNVGANFTFTAAPGIATILYRDPNNELDMFTGPRTAGAIDGPNDLVGPRTLTIALDLTPAGGYNGTDNFGTVTWSDSALGVLGSNTYSSAQSFGAVLITEVGLSSGTISALTLTQENEDKPLFFDDSTLSVTEITSSNALAGVVLLGAEATVWVNWRTAGAPDWAFSNQVSTVSTGLPPLEAGMDGLLPDRRYECAFFATNDTLGAEDWSRVGQFITLLTPAQTPTNLDATYDDGQILVTWTNTSQTADVFLLQWWEEGAAITNQENVTENRFLHRPLLPETTYFYRVGASNSFNGSFSGFGGTVSETSPMVTGPTLITPVAAKQSNSFSGQRKAENLIMPIGMNAEETILYNLDGSEPGEPTSANGVEWVTTSQLDEATAAAEGRVWLVADLGDTYALNTLHIWNFQWNLNGSTDLSNRGVNQFDVLVRTTAADTDDGTLDGTAINLDNPDDALIDNDAVFDLGIARSWRLALDDQSLDQAPNTDTYTGQTFDLTGTTARFVAIRVDTYYGGGGIGLGKVRFTGTLAEPLLLDLDYDGSDFVFSWPSTTGAFYNLLSTTGLVAGTWEPYVDGVTVTTNLPADASGTNTLVVPVPADPLRAFALGDAVLPPVFSDDFESGATGWVASSGGPTQWELGTPDVDNGFVLLDSAFSPTNCWGTDLNGGYGPSTDATLTSPMIALPDSPTTVEWYQLRDIEDSTPGLDIATLSVFSETDQTTTEIYRAPDGTQTDWTRVRIDLPPSVQGDQIQLVFRFQDNGDADLSWAGWYIDDVLIITP